MDRPHGSGSYDVGLVRSPFPRPSEAERRLAVQVLLHGPITRAELAERLDRSAASITRLAKPLVASGVLIECEPVIHGRARPQVPLDVDPDRAHVLGVNVATRLVTCTLTDLRGNPIESRRFETGSTSPREVVDAVTAALPTTVRVDAIGIGLGGNTSDARTVERAHLLGWHDVRLADLVEEHTGIPAIIGNDVECLTFGESWFGAARDRSDFNVVTVGSGIGFCAVRSGTLVRGRDAGRVLGTLKLTDVDGTTLPGAQFLENLALVDLFQQAGGRPGVGAGQILRLDGAGDPAAVQACTTRARRLGVLVATAAAFTLPTVTLVAGEGAATAQRHREAMLTGMASVRPHGLDLPQVVVLEHDRNRWSRGAAVLGIRALLGLEDDSPTTLHDEPMLRREG